MSAADRRDLSGIHRRFLFLVVLLTALESFPEQSNNAELGFTATQTHALSQFEREKDEDVIYDDTEYLGKDGQMYSEQGWRGKMALGLVSLSMGTVLVPR